MNPLPRVRRGLLRHLLDEQLLVYDSRDDRVHLLDPTTGCVLELLEEGGWTSEGLTAELAKRRDVAPDQGFLQLALEELRRADLLEERVAPPQPMVDVTRREIVRKLALTGAGTLLVPTVASLTATRLYAQGSAQIGVGGACASGAQCISGVCCVGICSNTGCPQATGAACNANGQCASGLCTSGVCVLRGNCFPCTTGSQCACGVCGSGGACCGTTGFGNGSFCVSNAECCSGNCSVALGLRCAPP